MHLCKQKGAQAVEFALALPFMILIILAVLDFGIIAFNKAILTNATREAARRGTVLTAAAWDAPAIRQIACNYARSALITVSSGTRTNDCTGTADPTITVTPAVSPAFGDPVTVSISYVVTGFSLGTWWNLGSGTDSVGSPITITASTQMRHE